MGYPIVETGARVQENPTASAGELRCDVAIIGGGPGGATLASLLLKYRPQTRIILVEREVFPRDHVGESQLPPIGEILAEMGCWDQVEAAGFPIKFGGTYRWGQSRDLWDFEFIPESAYVEEARPRPRSGQARQLALQVDRAVYDKILLEHARSLGAEILEGIAVRGIDRDGDAVRSLDLGDGRTVRASYYIDASGGAATLRRAMDVPVDIPTKLRNIAFWDYWENSEWASQFAGGATRILILSIGIGWIWYIPIGATRTSIGFVCNAQAYKDGERSADELYSWALQQDPLVADLIRNARRDGKTHATRDWSFLAERMHGENWFLVGESGGFADPILSAGLTLTQGGARELAYTLRELLDGSKDARWLKEQYSEIQRKRIAQHIRFADFWYASNGIFTDLQEQTREIARDAGMDLSPQEAFRWLATGGFTADTPGQVGIGGLDLAGARQVVQRLTSNDKGAWEVSRFNRYKLRLLGAATQQVPIYRGGRVERVKCYVRGRKQLALHGFFDMMVTLLKRESDLARLLEGVSAQARAQGDGTLAPLFRQHALQALEVMLNDGWVEGRHDPKRPVITLGTPREGERIHTNTDLNARIAGMRANAQAG